MKEKEAREREASCAEGRDRRLEKVRRVRLWKFLTCKRSPPSDSVVEGREGNKGLGIMRASVEFGNRRMKRRVMWLISGADQ